MTMSHDRTTKRPRRARPPNIDVPQLDNGLSPHPERSTRRDSKSGLRSLFSRNRSGKADLDCEEVSKTTSSRPASIRASLADLGNWPSRLHAARSEASLISRVAGDPRPSTADLRARPPAGKSQLSAAGADQAVSPAWAPPPLFRVYPQAVKHATLPTCTLSSEALARLGDAKSSRAFQGTSGPSEFVSELKSDTTRRLQRISGFRNNWACTSKIFVLVTSGYLLQYAAEGSFDRVPERVLQLTRTSAAYASDLIPGKHWVLRVVSSIDADGNTLADPKLVRSKLSAKDKRHVSNMLLVFETPENMDDWLAVLRREIQSLGGKKKLPETGSTHPDDTGAGSNTTPSNGTVVYNSRRLSGIIIRESTYTQEDALHDMSASSASIRPFSTYTIDDISTTASVVSSDGQRLDNLRDSSSCHRFSYMSSGQRTVLTSPGSSPASSPIRTSFCSKDDDPQPPFTTAEVRLRPNAAAIVSRRQSIQPLVSSFEMPVEQRSHLYGGYVPSVNSDGCDPTIPGVQNLSISHNFSRRSSLNASAITTLPHPAQPLDQERGIKSLRKPRPTALLTSRPLSIVIDQPSPRSPGSPTSLSTPAGPAQDFSADSSQERLRDIAAEPGVPGQTRSPSSCSETLPWKNDTYQPDRGASRPDVMNWNGNFGEPGSDNRPEGLSPRPATSLDSYSERSILPVVRPRKGITHRRSTFTLDESRPLTPQHISSVCSPKRSMPSLRPLSRHPVSHSVALDRDLHAGLVTPRSISQLVEGPPPAPPPSYALPPIPVPARHVKA
ncbi:hypothetical protein F5Y17DRAFT_1821 [Xylariaceae sp. FL0594]|nr:hypothetical protein F5Y17DRAFT_1821 [Xylariaceae sp. FL0594]